MIKKKKDTIKSLATHEQDVGSTEIQIGLLTDKIYKLADQMDRLRETEPKENIQWSEDDLIDLFGKKTIH